MAYNSFDTTQPKGEKAENEVKELLKKYYQVADDDIEHSPEADKEKYDWKIKSLNLTFEVKNDLMSETTGNVAIEYKCNEKISGLGVTTADF